MNDRRKFLTGCGTAVIAAMAVQRNLLAAVAGDDQLLMPEAVLTRADFAGLLKTRFRFYGVDTDASGRLKLIRIKDAPSSSGLEQFSLVFRGRADTPLPAGLYVAEDSNIGAIELYIKPTIGNERRQLYMADFSLLN